MSLDAAAVTTTNAPPPMELIPIHRYDFQGVGTGLVDRIGTAHGRVLGGAFLDGSGVLALDGFDDCVELPPRLLSSLTSVTILAWVRWDGGRCWQRIFDFGTLTAFPFASPTETLISAFYLTVQRCPGSTPSVAYAEGPLREHTYAMAPLTAPAMVQIGAVFDGPRQLMRLVINGMVVAEGGSRMRLEALRDDKAWIGRSLFAGDPSFVGELSEFRIYDHALDDRQLSHVFMTGPDAL